MKWLKMRIVHSISELDYEMLDCCSVSSEQHLITIWDFYSFDYYWIHLYIESGF